MAKSGPIGKQIHHAGQTITLHRSNYPNGRIAVYGMCDDGERWDVLSVNLTEVELGPGDFLVPVDGDPDSWVEACRRSGAFVDTGGRIAGMGLEVWRLAAITD